MASLRNIIVRLKTHDGFRRYLCNTSWIFGEYLLRIIAGLLVGIYVARYLGPEQFGILSYALAFVALFTTIAKLGLDSIVVRELVNHPDKRDLFLGTAFWLKSFGALLSFILLGIAVLFTSNKETTNLYIFLIAIGLIFQAFDVIEIYFQSTVNSKPVSISKLLQLLLSSFFKLYLISIHAELFWFVLASLIDQILLAIFLAHSYWRQKFGDFYGYFNIAIAKSMLMNSWPLILSSIAVTIYIRIDQIMIKEMLGDREVGLYSASARLSEAWYFVSLIITTSLFPAIVNAKKISRALYQTRLQRLYTLMVWLAICVALPVTFLGNWIMTLMYGAPYQESGVILSIQIWTGVFVALGVASERWMIAENLVGISFLRTIIGGVANIGLNLYLIPKHGIIGAAIATLLVQIFTTYLFDLFSMKTREAFLLKSKSLILYKGFA